MRKIEKILHQLELEGIKPGEFERQSRLSNGYLANTNNRGSDITNKMLDTIHRNSADGWKLIERALGDVSALYLNANQLAGGQYSDNSLVPFWSVDLFKQGVSIEQEIEQTPPTYQMDVPEFRGCLAFEAHTDAMDGVIKPGSIIFTSKVVEWAKHLEYGQIYWVICSDGRKYLRYVKRYREDPGKYFLLESENKAYDEFEMPKASINSIWLIHGHLSKRV